MLKKEERKNLVEIRGVDKRYELDDEVTYALAGIDLDIYQGEYLSLMGPSGSGKSTLFNMIGAL
ncbi:MAG: ATP-binding cassette domain-containing protein, partial [Planctomycetota bacterium]